MSKNVKIVIVDSLEYLKIFFGHYIKTEGQDLFISFAEYDPAAIDLFYKHGLADLGYDKDLIKGQDFLKAYLDLMGSLSEANQGRLWWATDIASKNRFTCKLPEYLQQFVQVMTIAQRQHEGLLIIYNPAPIIIPSLVENLRVRGFDLELREKPYARKLVQCSRRLKRAAGVIYYAARAYSRGFMARVVLRERISSFRSSSQPMDVLKTFIYPSSLKEGVYKDAFWGRLLPYLADKKKVLILADMYGKFLLALRKIKSCPETIIPWESFIRVKDVFCAVWEIFLTRFRVDHSLRFFDFPVARIVEDYLQVSINGIQVHQMLQYNALRCVLKYCPVGTFLMTYENNPWERMVTLAIRDHGQPVKVLGYQHSVVAPAAMNLFFSPREYVLVPLPDKILTVGKVSYDLMVKWGGYSKDKLVTSCALRYEYLSGGTIAPRQEGIRRIFIPLGGTYEIHAMIRYVLNQIGNDQNYEILIRPHPILPWADFVRQFGFDFEKYPSVRISQNSTLSEDLNWAHALVYWETTVALEALCKGKPVIHFDMGSLLSFDPIFDLKDLKWTVTQQDSLLDVIRSIDQLEAKEYQQQLKTALEFIHQYFHPVTLENLQLFEL